MVDFRWSIFMDILKSISSTIFGEIRLTMEKNRNDYLRAWLLQELTLVERVQREQRWHFIIRIMMRDMSAKYQIAQPSH